MTACDHPGARFRFRHVYESDLRINPRATRYTELTYKEALAAGVQVMDTGAFVLAHEQ